MSHSPYIEGPQGIPGIRGPKGEKGERGAMGFRGPKGEDGEQGPQGIQGFQGPRGDRGAMGFKGKDGRDGENGKQGPKGENGTDGVDGKDFDLSLVRPIADAAVSDHEGKFDHKLIDPFLVGTKLISETGMQDGMFIQYDGKNDRLIYANIKQITSQFRQIAGSGLALPSQAGNSGKFLTTDGSALSWATVSGSGDVVGPASAVANNVVLFDGTTGKLIKDSGVALSGTNTGDQLTFKTIAVSGQSDVVADSATDTLTLVAGSNITITTNAGSDSVTIAASGGGSGITRSVNVVSTPTNAGATASTDYVYFVSGTTTITLPTAVGNTNRYTIKNSGSNTVTVDTTSAQTIDGSATASLPVPNTSIDLISNNSNWHVV